MYRFWQLNFLLILAPQKDDLQLINFLQYQVLVKMSTPRRELRFYSFWCFFSYHPPSYILFCFLVSTVFPFHNNTLVSLKPNMSWFLNARFQNWSPSSSFTIIPKYGLIVFYLHYSTYLILYGCFLIPFSFFFLHSLCYAFYQLILLYRLPVPRPGQVLGLVGTNGIGKSTALKVLAGKLKPNLGRFNVSIQATISDFLHITQD